MPSNFYTQLPVIKNFFDASNENNYHSLPSDWYVAVSDIVDSTTAVENNLYKKVNMLGASPIVGILNIADRNEIPYIFGGDGCSFCTPPTLYDSAKNVLAQSRKIGKKEYNLDLRTALIPISHIEDQGYTIKVARYRASEYYIQGVFSGGGISYAEEILKGPNIQQYAIYPSDSTGDVDFSGLECRWKEVKQPNKEVLTLLVKHNPATDFTEEAYQPVLQKMRDIFGFDDITNPIDPSQLKMTTSFNKLMNEVKFRTFEEGWLSRIIYLVKTELQILIGKLLMALNYETSATDWSLYKRDMSLNSDHRKFDDMLRVVISGTPKQRQQLEAFLQQQHKENKLAYGIHIADAAMITCMVFQYHREHIHFVDGSGGGYVSASKQLKEQLNSLSKG
ncbi:Protein of unknown function (DUF3095) [Fodinibius salinus]|uniref:DUF3095 domain-containing protein n=1 Tax=Fodinibius salinus TaxID=860790 RepID=A0A5D3YJB3_9BACT|nr:DUF3095 domain-containing protein [Fodinibius salinus]TYP93652.1 Protein of unknown function (DUF3095) [Fodinibius salinus]